MARIGVFICHCGENIARTVDVVSVTEVARTWPGVVYAEDYRFCCSDPGQSIIRDAIKEHNLTGLVISACSPKMHEKTFRNLAKASGMNPYLCECSNIREQCSWVHHDKEVGTEKAIDLVRMMVEKVRMNHPLEPIEAPVTKRVLVVGAGIAGIQASLDLAEAGLEVVLVERNPSIGGHMAQLSETFPTLDCSMCILSPKMSAVKEHPDIKLLTYSEVEKVEGFIGNYTVSIRKKPRYVIEDLCVGCNECVTHCVFKKPKFPDEFNEGLGKRKPVYIPFPQATPQGAFIDPETCLQLTTGKCKQTCVTACPKDCIDFEMVEEIEEVEVGAIILATGFGTYKPELLPQYGYGKLDNVYTSLQMERMLSSSGPTEGEILLKDGTAPKTVGIIHCAGSRDENANIWCSKVCCMYSLKLAHLIQEFSEAQVFNFYIDIRAAGKGYEEFYLKVIEENVMVLRGRPALIEYEEQGNNGKGNLLVHTEDTISGTKLVVPVDMVVLSLGFEPDKDAVQLAKTFNISRSPEGFFMERHVKLAPVATTTDGVYIVGGCQGPKDIPETVAQASAAAASVLGILSKDKLIREPTVARVNELNCIGCFQCEKVCPYSAIEHKEIRDHDGNLIREVALVNDSLCHGCGPCAAICPSKCIDVDGITEEQIYSQLAVL